jgi:hypothetical protein
MNISKFALAALLAASSASCWAAGESKLDLVYRRAPPAPEKQGSGSLAQQALAASDNQAQVQARAGKCTVVVNTPNDVRANRETLGTTFRDNPILSNQNPTAWLESALMEMKTLGFTTVSGKSQSASGAGSATVTLDLDKLYIWNHGLNLHATVVAKAKIRGAGGQTLDRKYRVNSTKLNWWNADSEFIDTLNLAADRLVDQIAADIDTLCLGKSST